MLSYVYTDMGDDCAAKFFARRTSEKRKAGINELRSDMNAMGTRIMRWILGRTIAAASMAFTIAKFVH
jgi:hypothetical protein